jgi:hypothetical protein
MRRKVEFVSRVRDRAKALPWRKEQMAVSLAISVNEDSIPDDLTWAADRLVSLVLRLRREVPAG